MKISYSWLKDYIDCDLTPQQVAEAMTSIGIEVDSVEEIEEIPGGLEGVVVAEVVECEPHPNSDHLHVTKVDDGSGELQDVVCGAPNVAKGQKVLFARVGAVLPGGLRLKKSKLRGIDSYGMICADDELGIGSDHSGIKVLPADAPVGMSAKQWLGIKTEAVIDALDGLALSKARQEALAKRLPMVLLQAVDGCEPYNLRFCVDHGAAVTAQEPGEIAALCRRLIDDEAALEDMRAHIEACWRKHPAKTVCDCLCTAEG